ncbi:MAG: helix-turn-helix domain-containing protein [Oscillospiraceae bacterium]|nr:helix-turn-helix domain-containing protein [Oscillospiraceae bacterium]
MNDKNSYLSPFPRRLRLLIDETRVSQQEIADYVGVTRQAVSHWKDGKTIPDCFSFKKIAEFFKVPLEYLYGDTDSKVRENMALTESLGLSDEVIEKLQLWANYDEMGACLALTKILSYLMEEASFDKFVFEMQLMLRDYLESRFFEEEEWEDIPSDEVLQVALHTNEQLRKYGLQAVSRATIAASRRYRAMEVFSDATRVATERIYTGYRERLLERREGAGER